MAECADWEIASPKSYTRDVPTTDVNLVARDEPRNPITQQSFPAAMGRDAGRPWDSRTYKGYTGNPGLEFGRAFDACLGGLPPNFNGGRTCT